MHTITQIRLAVKVAVLLCAGMCLGQQDAPAPSQSAPNSGGATPAAGSVPTMQREAPAAQDASKQEAATPAATSINPITQSITEEPDVSAAIVTVPDQRPLSGVLGLTLGSITGPRNIIRLHVNAEEVIDSNSAVLGTQSDYQGATSLGATLRLQHPMRRGDLDLDYRAGVVFYNGRTATNWFPQLSLSVPFALRRWTVTLAEHLRYTPESIAGAGLGFSNYGAGAVASGGFANGLTPNQSIYTPVSSRLSNTSAVQVQYGFSSRSSWTAAVTYGNLYYPDGAFKDSHHIVVRTGFNRSLTARDTVSVFYDYATYGQAGQVTPTNSHSVELAYARRLTGRLSWSISGGPQFVSRIAGERSTAWTLSSRAHYELRRNAVRFSYRHGVSGGAGVFSAAHSDRLALDISRAISGRMSVGASGILAKTANFAGSGEFRSGTAGVRVQRSLGQLASMYFTYAFQRQVADGACSGLLCSGLSRQVFGFGFGWGPRPWVIR